MADTANTTGQEKTIAYNGITINIVRDEDAPNPRNPEHLTNLGTLVTREHDRYKLGDEQYGDIEDFLVMWNFYHETPITREGEDDEDFMARLQAKFDEGNIWVPVRIFEHSDLSLECDSLLTGRTSFSWGTGFAGLIYVERDVPSIAGLSDSEVIDNLRAEVELYDTWRNEGGYGYVLEVPGDDEPFSSCYGFIGEDHDKSGLLSSAKAEIDRYIAATWLSDVKVGDEVNVTDSIVPSFTSIVREVSYLDDSAIKAINDKYNTAFFNPDGSEKMGSMLSKYYSDYKNRVVMVVDFPEHIYDPLYAYIDESGKLPIDGNYFQTSLKNVTKVS